jgi:hypothetical protein
MVDWGRQIPIMFFATIFAVYWSGRNGLWDAVKGKPPVDKQWMEARSALLRRLDHSQGRFEVIDGTNQRGEKRVFIMNTFRPSADGSPTPAPQVAAELVPVRKPFGQRVKERKGKLSSPAQITDDLLQPREADLTPCGEAPYSALL